MLVDWIDLHYSVLLGHPLKSYSIGIDSVNAAKEAGIGSNFHSENLIHVGGPAHAVSVGLRVFGDDLLPDEITKLLGSNPTFAHKKGDVILNAGQQRIATTGSWLLTRKRVANGDLEQEIKAILDLLTDDHQVWAELTSRFQVDLFCGVFFEAENSNGGFSLSPDVTKALAERNLRISFDLYWF